MRVRERERRESKEKRERETRKHNSSLSLIVSRLAARRVSPSNSISDPHHSKALMMSLRSLFLVFALVAASSAQVRADKPNAPQHVMLLGSFFSKIDDRVFSLSLPLSPCFFFFYSEEITKNNK